MVIGAVTVAYNLPGLTSGKPLRFDANALAGIFLGRIARWNHADIMALNPGRVLPDLPIRPVHRIRTSGTRVVFAAYLAGSAEWRRAQTDVELRWPVGTSNEGNEGVAAELRASPGALGFLELSYADLARLPVAALRNVAGEFVEPDSASLALATQELLSPRGADTLEVLVGARAAGAYPVAALTRIVADRVLDDPVKGAHLLAFARWAYAEGAPAAVALGYVPLPPAVVERQLRRLGVLVPGQCPTRNVQ
jgi:phosphate transport system substrate-binding protein